LRGNKLLCQGSPIGPPFTSSFCKTSVKTNKP